MKFIYAKLKKVISLIYILRLPYAPSSRDIQSFREDAGRQDGGVVAILGIESLVYGVEDVGVCTRFFDDFGLPRVSQTDSSSSFKLEEGSKVVLRRIDDPALPRSALTGPGVREVVW